MEASQIEAWRFGRRVAADLVGMTSGQIGNYLVRYDLFPGTSKGKGHHVGFQLRDLMQLKAAGILIEAGLSPEQAAAALRPHAGPYSALLHDGHGPGRNGPAFTFPGTLFFTRNSQGRWVQNDGWDKPLCIQIRAWPIFDDLWPRVRARILLEGKADPQPYPGDVVVGLEAFEENIAKLRAERWRETV